MFDRLKKFLNSLTTSQLVFAPFFISFFFIGALFLVKNLNHNQNGGKWLLLNIIFFLWGCSGIPMIIRRESPPPWYSQGWLAVIQGSIIVILAWCLIFIVIVKLIL